ASYKNRTEKKIVLSIAQKLKRILQKDGFKIYMTRDSDKFVKLPKRTEFANKKMANIFVSIHANAAPTKKTAKIFNGIEIYYLSVAHSKRAKNAAAKENSVMFENKDLYTKNDYLSLLNREKIVESHKLGLDVDKKILSHIQKKYKVSNGGVKSANFWVLVGAQMPAILVETGYISHPKEGKNLLSSTYQSLLAKGIAEGIERYLKNTRK
ncbi:MAG: N-acetylmuramoyl-L-alanine amidase, partial [Sulfurovaceae bacterium]|nr:N-acetylmuramoyl-L-alanine amidase [Sulfurovaceae bacterium]